MLRPRWRFIGESYEVVLVPWGDEPERAATRLTPAGAVRELRTLLDLAPSRGVSAHTLAEIARYVSARHDVTRSFRAVGARDVVAAALARGVLVAWRAALRFVPAPAGGAFDRDEEILRVPLASSLVRTWIEIELVDMDGNPVAGERYWIKLPDGHVREGALDRNGRAYFGDLEAGTALIRWPDLDEEATVQTSRYAPQLAPDRERTWVEFELVDMAGEPIVGERYEVRLPDGALRAGRTDDRGRMYFGNLDPGECSVRWPDLDRDGVEPVRRSVTASSAAPREGTGGARP